MKKLIKFVGIAALVCAAMFVSSCASTGGATTAAAKAPAQPKPIELLVGTWASAQDATEDNMTGLVIQKDGTVNMFTDGADAGYPFSADVTADTVTLSIGTNQVGTFKYVLNGTTMTTTDWTGAIASGGAGDALATMYKIK
jgi:hypothetical protein